MLKENYTLFQKFTQPDKLVQLESCLKEKEIQFQFVDSAENEIEKPLDSAPEDIKLQIHRKDVARVGYLISQFESVKVSAKSMKFNGFWTLVYYLFAVLGIVTGIIAGLSLLF